MSARATLASPIFLALDVDSADRALVLARDLRAYVGGFKIGPRLLLRHGAGLVRAVAELGPVFLDNKHFDIPSTTVAAVRASFDLGASFCTVHAQVGAAALRDLARLEADLSAERPFRILAVTILTSFTPATLAPNANARTIADQTKMLAELVLASGLSGLVCSPDEVADLRRLDPGAYLVTPGVRLGDDARGDQARIATPARALGAGASALVVGRPIYDSPEPTRAARMYHEEIQKIESHALSQT